MEYRNPQIPDGINVSRTHPLLDFLRLLGGLAVAGALVLGVAVLLADKLARYIPFSAEERIAARFAEALPPASPQSADLQRLADRIAANQEMPAGMRVRVHFVDNPTVNAFATLGGNVIVFRGLLEKMPSENALAMVLGHEIAHVKLRHPVATLGRGLAIGVAVATLSAGTGSDIAGRTLGNAGLLTVLTYSRAQEREADADALRAVAKLYGHVADADRIFRLLAEEAAKLPVDAPAFLRTHPLDAERIAAIEAMAAANGWQLAGDVQPLPEVLRKAPAAANP